MIKYLLFLAIFSATSSYGLGQTLSQTRTATYLNNLNNFRDVYGDQNYPKATAADVAADDGQYASTNKLVAISDPTKPFTAKSISSLALQGFGFTIPDNATIENIAVRLRRFKTGTATVNDYILSVMQSYSGNPTNGVSLYGAMWRKGDVYLGNTYPNTETEYIFSQSGSGNNGGYNHDQAYQWTPAMVNVPYFGVRIDNYPPIGRGSAVIYYDLVDITVQYSVPPAVTSRSPNVGETRMLKEPIVYPNPFTTKTNIQFTALENGKARVELFNNAGSKIRTLFSGNVVQGQLYNVSVTEAQLPKGVYVYRIDIGKQIYTDRLIKLE
jgi:type IX secretion system substrate protein